MKKLVALSTVAALAVTGLYADEAADIKKLKKDVKRLKKTLSQVKAHDGGDNLKWDVDFRTAIDRLEYKYASGRENKNPGVMTNRLWLGMGYAVSSDLVFKGQLAMYKAYGAAPTNNSTGFPQRGYGFDTFDWVVNENPNGDGTVRVREAYWLYKNDSLLGTDVSWTASVGRRPSTNGFLANLREDDRAKSPLAHGINVEFDGASFKFGLDKVTGVDGMYWKLCLGRGLTNARARFNSDGGLNPYGDFATDGEAMKNIDMAGFIFVPYDDGQYTVETTYYRGFNVPGYDLANGSVAYNPATGNFDVTGTGMVGSIAPVLDTTNPANPVLLGMQAATANDPANLEMVNLGHQDGAGISFMANGIGDGISDFLDDTIFFASFAWSKTDPKNNRDVLDLNAFSEFYGQSFSQIATGLADQETEFNTDLDQDGTIGSVTDVITGMETAANGATTKSGMLGSTDDETGTSYWVGLQMPALVTDDGRVGIEYNHGSKYWRGFTYGEDTLTGSKLATRGDAYEIYYTQPLMEGLSMQLRATKMVYEYTGSQGFFGGSGYPLTMDEALAFGMDPVEEATDIRLYFRYRY